MEYQYTYLVGALIFFILFWLPVYLARPALRRPILVMSLLTAPLGAITTFFFLQDYWAPHFVLSYWLPLEDVLFSFAVGGFSGGVYEAIVGERLVRQQLRHKRYIALVFFVLGVLALTLGWYFEVLSLYVSCVLLLVYSIFLLALRPHLVPAALTSAVLTVCAFISMYSILLWLYPGVISALWLPGVLSGYDVIGIPIEELAWAACWGLLAAPAFELVALSRYCR